MLSSVLFGRGWDVSPEAGDASDSTHIKVRSLDELERGQVQKPCLALVSLHCSCTLHAVCGTWDLSGTIPCGQGLPNGIDC